MKTAVATILLVALASLTWGQSTNGCLVVREHGRHFERVMSRGNDVPFSLTYKRKELRQLVREGISLTILSKRDQFNPDSCTGGRQEAITYPMLPMAQTQAQPAQPAPVQQVARTQPNILPSDAHCVEEVTHKNGVTTCVMWAVPIN